MPQSTEPDPAATPPGPQPKSRVSSPTHANPQANIGYFATRPLQLRLLTGFVLATALTAWLTGWTFALVLCNEFGWNSAPFRWARRIISINSGSSIFVITSYAPLFSIASFCVIAGLRPALKLNLWVLVSLAMVAAAAVPIAVGLSILLAGGQDHFKLPTIVSYLVLLPLLPMAAWVVNHQYNVRLRQLLKACCMVFAVTGTMLTGGAIIAELRYGLLSRSILPLLFISFPYYASFGLCCLTLYHSRKLYKQQLQQLAGSACLQCGYDLQGLPEETPNCPECGCGFVRRHCDLADVPQGQ